MLNTEDGKVLDAVLESWDRNNTVLLNLLSAVPSGGLEARTTESSPSVSEMFMHMHHERMVSVSEEAPEISANVPDKEWIFEPDPDRISQLLTESAKAVRDAVESKVKSGQAMNLNYAHPIHLIQFLIFHEGYHHGQIKTALKVTGRPITDDVAGPLTWDVWRAKKRSGSGHW